MLKRLLRIKDYANKKNTSLKLKYMFEYGNMNKIKEQSLFLHNELPIRLAQRAIQLERLPNNITNLYSLQKIHEMYINSFEQILDHPKPNNSQLIDSFTNLIGDIKKKHSDIELDISNAIIDYRFTDPNYYNKDCKLTKEDFAMLRKKKKK